MNALELRPTRMVVVDNVMAPHEASVFEVQPGRAIGELCPQGRFPYVCRLDGQWTLRKDWGLPLQPGSTIEFFAFPQGGGDGGSDAGRIVLTIAVMAAAIYFLQPQLAGMLGPTGAGLSTATAGSVASMIATTAAGALVNALVPSSAAGGAASFDGQSSSPTYTTGLSGNQVRLDQAIPVLYGYNKTYPDFAAQPYSNFADNDDQYYYALLCIGQGKYSIKALMLDDTPLSNFGDVTSKVLAPGEAPTMVSAAMVNCSEVGGNTLETARFVGPFVACRAGDTSNTFEVDITFSRGLATYNGSTGAAENKTVGWQVHWRTVNDFGVGTSEWVVISESLTAAQSSPVRRTYRYTTSLTGRLAVRLVRTTLFDDSSRVANTMEWSGLRCELVAPATLEPTATYLEVKMRASEQLTGLSQRKLAVLSQRVLRTWNPGTGWSAENVETRNPAWALADKWTNQFYGDKYPDAHCDLLTLYNYSLVWDARQDRFDAVFDQAYESAQADQMIAQAGRAAVFRRAGHVMTLSRDEQKDLPVTAYTARNIKPGSVEINYAFTNENTPDGVIVEYWDNRAWDWRPIVCPCPGVVTPVKPQRLRLFGVSGRTHANREGIYHAANTFYRRKFPSWATELEGIFATFGSLVVLAPSLPGWGQGGDVVNYVLGTLEVTLSEPPVWTAGATHYLAFVNTDGSLTVPSIVVPGSSEFSVKLLEALPNPPVFSASNMERTRYVFGAASVYQTLVRMLAVQNSLDESGARTYNLSAVVEDNRVHTADLALLPAAGVVQDPVDIVGVTDDGGGLAVVVNLTSHTESRTTAGYLGAMLVEFSLENDGRAKLRVVDDGVATESYYPLEWLVAAPHTAAEAALYEARATEIYAFGTYAGTFGSWLGLGTSRAWSASATDTGSTSSRNWFTLEIRNVATTAVQASVTIDLMAATYYDGGGGGEGPGSGPT